MDRRDFLKSAAPLGLMALYGGMGASWARAQNVDWAARAKQDLKPMDPIPEHVFAGSSSGIVSSSHPLATEAALHVLKNGGSAADAYLTAAFAQTVLEPTMTTLAGGLGINFYEAKTGKLFQGGGGFGPVAAESEEWSEYDSMTGRAVMVPGWARGAEIVHKRFGKLSWGALLEPAIEFAEKGFVIDHLLWGWTFEKKAWVGRYPEGRAIWFPNGHLLGVGDTLRQPELAQTLKRLRDEGPDYFYTGQWAKKCVEAVRARGGRITLDDFKNYRSAAISGGFRPGSSEGPATTTYRGHEIAPPSLAMFALAGDLVEAGDLRARGKPTENADSLYYLIRIMQEIWHTGLLYKPEIHDDLVSKDYARQVWKLVESGPPRPFRGFAAGTCGLTIVDTEGNFASGTHSSSSTPYGTGIFVDGVVLNRIVYMRKYDLPRGVSTSVWLFKDGKPFVTMATPSRAFTENLLQNVVNVVEYGMDLLESVEQPRFGHPDPKFGATQIEANFSEEVLQKVEKRGVQLLRVSPMHVYMGSCHAVMLDHASGRISGIADPRRRGLVKGL